MILAKICLNYKRQKIFGLILFLLIVNPINAQKIKGGFQVGGVISQVDGDDQAGYNKIGLFVGSFATLPFEKYNLQLQMEINYAQKGSRKYTGSYFYKISLHQIEVPLLLGWNPWKNLWLEIGPSFNFLVDAKEILNDIEIENQSKFHLFELGGIAGISYCIREHYGFGVRFNYSLSPIGRNAVARGYRKLSLNMWNNAFVAFFYYQF